MDASTNAGRRYAESLGWSGSKLVIVSANHRVVEQLAPTRAPRFLDRDDVYAWRRNGSAAPASPRPRIMIGRRTASHDYRGANESQQLVLLIVVGDGRIEGELMSMHYV